MNALCWLGLSAVTWYLAGLYQMEILGIIVLIQIFLFVSMFVISLYLRDKISGTIFVKNGFEERGQEAEAVLRLSNRGRIPMIGLCASIRWHNSLFQTKGRIKVKENCMPGDQTEEAFCLPTENCGNIRIWAAWMKVRDPMGLFAWKRRLDCQTCLTILPNTDHIGLDGQNLGSLSGGQSGYRSIGLDGTEMDQVRGYRPGDSPRQIHWKLSARYGELMVKQYHREKGGTAVLLAAGHGWGEKNAKEINDFLDTVSAVIRGFLLESWQIRLMWKSSENGELMEYSLLESEEYQEAMAALMKEIGLRKIEKGQERTVASEEEMQVKATLPGNAVLLKLDWDGTLYADGTPVLEAGAE